MTYSKLTDYYRPVPHCGNTINGDYSPNRTMPIDTISIHSAIGHSSLDGYYVTFDTNGISANYGIAWDGGIGCYCPEEYRSWCSSSGANDNRAITIEVATDTTEPYAVSDAAYESLIKLLVDICQRNGIKKMLFKNDKNLIGQPDKQNVTLHKWFAATSCPNTWIIDHLPEICDKVNEQLLATQDVIYRVQVGAFKYYANAQDMLKKLQSDGYTGFIVEGRYDQ